MCSVRSGVGTTSAATQPAKSTATIPSSAGSTCSSRAPTSPADPGWKLLIYTAEPASAAADALALLASWTATSEQPADLAPKRVARQGS